MIPSRLPQRIGVILVPERKLNEPALRFLVLAINKEQSFFQFEFLSAPPGDPLLRELSVKPASRLSVKQKLPAFAERMAVYIAEKAALFSLRPPEMRRVVESKQSMIV